MDRELRQLRTISTTTTPSPITRSEFHPSSTLDSLSPPQPNSTKLLAAPTNEYNFITTYLPHNTNTHKHNVCLPSWSLPLQPPRHNILRQGRQPANKRRFLREEVLLRSAILRIYLHSRPWRSPTVRIRAQLSTDPHHMPFPILASIFNTNRRHRSILTCHRHIEPLVVLLVSWELAFTHLARILVTSSITTIKLNWL